MSEIVKLPKEAAEELQELRNEGWTDYRIIARIHDRWTVVDKSPLIMFAHQHPSPLLRALADGYEVEQTPEDKVRKRYLHLQNNPQGLPWMAVRAEEMKMTLDSLNIKIDGVNA